MVTLMMILSFEMRNAFFKILQLKIEIMIE